LKNRLWLALTVSALILIYWAQMLHSIRGQSLTWDEGDHIFAGYESWKTHDFGFNPEHPPMVKQVATLPLLPLELKVPPDQHRFFKMESYLDGRELLFRNGPADGGHYRAGTLIFRARLFASIFGVLAALLVFLATTEMFSVTAGLIALILFCFEPNLLAHGAYVTTDMAAACTIFATIYAFWRWMQRPTPSRLVIAGLVAGIALAAKHSTILLAPMLLLIAVVALVLQRRNARATPSPPAAPRITIGRMAIGGIVITVIAVAVLWVFYGFRYSARPAGLALSPTLRDYVRPLAPPEARGILLAARFHLLPESWLYGLADVRRVASGYPSFLLGRVYLHGTWFYFPVLFVIKSTLAMLALLALSLFAMARRWLAFTLELYCVLIPPILYFLVSMGSHLNIGARHILPVFLFCCVLCGVGAAALIRAPGTRRSRERWTLAILALLIFHVASTLHASPNYLSYANEAWGGPSKTYLYLSDSNADWAQQLIAVSAALREHHVDNCYLAYFATPMILPADYGIPCRLLPTFDSYVTNTYIDTPSIISGTVLISAGDLNGFEFGSSALNPYESFRTLRPQRIIQNGVLWYNGTFSIPLAGALPYIERSSRALKANNLPLALSLAHQAEQIAPGDVAPEFALGDALAASGRPGEARAAYLRAAPKIDTMEPEARELWRGILAKKLAGKPAAPPSF
jgi:4-amino-4-deoxy-L-arabinose transferase-like glycosyltransferase